MIKKLAAVDLTASIMCLENKMPMLVFGLNEAEQHCRDNEWNIYRNKSDGIMKEDIAI